MKTISLESYKNIIVLTGAGISVASGIKPFRGPGGLWEDPEIERYSDISEIRKAPNKMWEIFGPLRDTLKEAQPNLAHQILVEVEKKLRPEQRLTLITQNVDGLHQKAGSKNVLELHGTIHLTRCFDEKCLLLPFKDSNSYLGEVPECKICREPLRPDVVFFGEALPLNASWFSKIALRDCDLFMAIGTSGSVWPAANFVNSAEYVGARTILVNLEKMEPRNKAFQEEYLGKAEEILPKLFSL